MKKGELQRVFIYVLSLVVISLVFVYGYKAIFGFSKQADDVAMLKFSEDLKSHITSIASDYGSVREYIYSMPSGVDEVCFTDPNTYKTPTVIDQYGSDDSVIKAAISSGIPEHVFLRKSKQTEEKLDVGELDLFNCAHFVCVPVKAGKITLRLEGLGNKAKLIVPECNQNG